jgi:predicted nucleic acid-binding protein
MVSAPVYAELLAGPLRTEAALDQFFAETEIEVDWMLEENVWREAGKAYREYVQRRKKSSGGASRRILADFLIGAHALVGGHSLLTIDKSHYATAFPKLKVISI